MAAAQEVELERSLVARPAPSDSLIAAPRATSPCELLALPTLHSWASSDSIRLRPAKPVEPVTKAVLVMARVDAIAALGAATSEGTRPRATCWRRGLRGT